MKRVLYIPLILLVLLACNSKQEPLETTVHLKGQLVDFGTQDVRMRYDGASSALGNSRDILLKTDNQGFFDTTIVLNEPQYFNISRNTLYLSPGDDLTVELTQDSREAIFSGIGAQVNTYMKGRLFPKGGSFLESGRQIKDDFQATKETIDSLAAIRQHQLDTLSGATPLFKELEGARIKADVANSYISFYTYASSKNKIEPEYKDRNVFMEMLTPLLKPILADLNDPKYLDVAVVRDVFSYNSYGNFGDMWFSDISFPTRTKELYSSMQLQSKLASEVSKEIVDEVTQFTQSLENKDFSDVLNFKVNQVKKRLPGEPAIDLELTDVDGKVFNLSDFKGKVLYIDLWATWCGPCIKESPAFEALATEYNEDEIVFLPISTDSNQKDWLGYLESNKKNLVQYYTSDINLVEGWDLKYIPRFLLIDKDFNIADAFAPRPSSEGINEVLNSIIGE